MIFIPPMEIATRIMTLIDNAKTELILVSPYISIDNWAKFKKCLQRAVDRGVNITIYARENANQNLDTIKSFKVNLYLVKDLHAKIYLNESYAIASSQNLIQYSDDNSIDFGYSTETEEEREQLLGLISQYLIVSKPAQPKIQDVVKMVEKKETVTQNELVVFKNSEIKKIYDTFNEKFDSVRINNDSTYVYCSKLFPFGDVMFREGLEIRFNFQKKDNNNIVNILENLDFENIHYQFKKEFKIYNDRNRKFLFVPQNVTDFQKLTTDYLSIVDQIFEKLDNSSGSLVGLVPSFNRDAITKICQTFKDEFPESNFKVNSKQLYSSDLFSFAAVLIDQEYKIKIEMDSIDFKGILQLLEKMNFRYNYSYATSIYQEYESRIYFSIIPKEFDNLQLLIADYIAITREILIKTENVVHKAVSDTSKLN